MVVVYFIELLGVMLDRSFEIVIDIRSDDIFELFRDYVGNFA